MSQIDWEEGRRLYLQGKSPLEISKQLNCNKSSVCRKVKAQGWERAETVLASVARGVVPSQESGELVKVDRERSASNVKARIQDDVAAVLDALEAICPADLGLGQLATRERVASDVAKRAASVFDIEEREKPVVNIAVLSQLPEQVVG